MYSPPILFSIQDDINDRRRVRSEYRTSARQELLQSVITTAAQKRHADALSMDKKTKADMKLQKQLEKVEEKEEEIK